MKNKNSNSDNLYKDILEEAYFRKAWHGPNLHSSLKGVTADQSLKRPAKDRHNIYEITVHACYGVYRIIHRIKRSKEARFPFKGVNWWFQSPNILTEADWRKVKKLLKDFHEELYNLILDLSQGKFKITSESERQKISRLIVGIAMHDVYHAGQIQLIKKLIKS